jgi:hypothetical protein
MSTVELVMATSTFKELNNMMFISPSVIGIFENAIKMFNAGFSYKEWESTTCAAKATKKIVLEIFQYLASN